VGSDPWGAWIDEEGHQESWQSETFRAERWNEDSLCDFRHELDSARLEAGGYTLVMAVLEGQPSPDTPMTASACAAIPIHIDGETVIEMPEIPPCEVDFAGDEDPWRNPSPVDPSTPGAGTLQIVFPDLGGGGGGGEVMVVVLPAGTTLNDVGREEVWPVGATRTWLFDSRAGDREQVARDVRVPVAELPASGLPRAFDPQWLAEGPSADRLPLALLAPGDYDVHVQVAIHDPPEEDETESAKNDRCVSFEVSIDRDTIADLPELRKCPRVP
jgi:hypothetical protein